MYIYIYIYILNKHYIYIRYIASNAVIMIHTQITKNIKVKHRSI